MKEREYTYKDRQWSVSDTLPEVNEKENFDSWIDHCGFQPGGSKFGLEGFPRVEVYETKGSPRFLACVSPLETTYFYVVIPDFPNLMMFLREYVPVFISADIYSHLDLLVQWMDKLFHAYHGHGPLDSCYECDPVGWKRQVQEKTGKKKIAKTGKAAQKQ